MRFSGHETFALRYAWLPKAYRYLRAPDCPGFGDEDSAMVALGLGKNMVRALRFWVEIFGLAEDDGKGKLVLTPLAHMIFGSNGLDPFMEDPRTLWLLHWHASVRPDDPVCAWDILVNRWPKAEFTKSEAVAAFRRESERRTGKPHSDVTLGQHFDVFIHMYVPTRSGHANVEETLDSPLVELGLIEQVADRRSGLDGRSEPVYAFRRDPKSDVSPELFSYFIDQCFTVAGAAEATRTFRELLVGPYAPGQVLRLPEASLRERLDLLSMQKAGYRFQLSAVQSTLQRDSATFGEAAHVRLARQVSLLHAAYRADPAAP